MAGKGDIVELSRKLGIVTPKEGEITEAFFYGKEEVSHEYWRRVLVCDEATHYRDDHILPLCSLTARVMLCLVDGAHGGILVARIVFFS